MPKSLARNRDNQNSIYGLVDQHGVWLDQSLTVDSSPIFSGATITHDLLVGGDFTVNGMTTVINTDVLTVKDNIIEINSDEIGPGVTVPSGLSGIQVNRGGSVGYQSVFRETDDAFCIGQVGDLQVVATRENTPLNSGVMIFNNSQKRLDSVTNLPLSMTFSSAEISANSATGAVRIQGGLGITGDIRSDSTLYINANYINTVSNNLEINTGYGLNLNVTDFVKIPVNKPLRFGSSSDYIAYESGLLRMSSTGVININAGVGQPVSLRTNSPLNFGQITEKITFDGTNMVLDAANSFYINSLAFFTNSSASISSNSGSVKMAGGLSISNVTDAVSSSNGGSISTAGGVGIAKKLFVAGIVNFENTNELVSLTVQGGATVNKKLIVGSNYLGNPASSSGIFIQSNGNTFTDNATASSGTVTAVNCNYLGINAIGATNSNISTTNSSTLFIEGAPVAGTNQTIVNTYAMYINGGLSRFNGNLEIKSTTTSTALLVEGGVTINKNLNVNNKFDVSSNLSTAPSSTGIFISQSPRTITDNVSVSSVSENHVNVLGQPTFSSTNVITTGSSATLCINGEPVQGTNQTITNAYALWIKSGKFKLDSNFDISGVQLLTNTGDAMSSTVGGAFTNSGGAAIAKKLFVGGVSTFENVIESVDTGTGSVITFGGLAVAKNTNIGRKLRVGVDTFSDIPGLGRIFKTGGSTYTDNTTTTVTNLYSTNLFEQTTVSATNTGVTTSQASTVYISGPPIQGANQTLTETLALNVNTGNSKLGGNLTVAGTSTLNGILSVNATTNLQTVNITGPLTFTGTGIVSVNTSSNINLTTTGSSDVNIVSGDLVTLNSVNTTIDTSAGVSIDAGSSSNLSVAVGTLTLSGPTVDINSTTTSIQPTSTILGLKLATTTSNVPITIGNSVSETTVADNLTVVGDLTVNGETTILNSTVITTEDNAIVVNSMPAGISDGGFLVKRYQTPNNTSLGQVVLDTPTETGAFQSSLRLAVSASTVTNYYRGWWIKITSGAASNFVRRIKTSNATRDIVLYTTTDNGPNFTDGMDLGATIATSDTYQLFPGTYAGMFFNDTSDEFAVGNVPFDAGAGTFPLHGYLPLHVKSLIIDDGLALDSDLIIDQTSQTALVVRKDGNSGNVFTVDSVNSILKMENPINTVNSTTRINFMGLNNLSAEVSYSGILSKIKDNSTPSGELNLSVLVNNSQTNYITLDGLNQKTIVSSITELTNTTTSTSASASFLTTGGITSTDATDATSLTSGGSLTTLGGTSVAKKLFVGGDSNFSSGVVNTCPSTNGNPVNILFYANTGFSGNLWKLGQNLTGTGVSSFSISNSVDTPFTISSVGVAMFPKTTVSSSTSTGSVVISGGVGIALDLNVGGNITGTWGGNIISVSKGGSGAGTFNTNSVLLGNGTGTFQAPSSITYSSSTLTLPKIVSNDTTDSTSSITGSIQIAGGVGIAKKLYVGADINIGNNLAFSSTDTLISNQNGSNSGSVSVSSGSTFGDSDGAGILLKSNSHLSNPGKITLLCGNVNSTGYLSIVTGTSERVAVNYDGTVNFISTTQSSSTTIGAVKIAGGVAIVKNVYVGGILNVAGDIQLSTIASGTWNGSTVTVPYGGTGATTFTSNAVLLGNGTGVLQTNAGLLFSSSTLSVPKISSTDTTQSTSSSSGAITTSGGVGIAKNVYLGEGLFITGSLGVGTTTNVNSVLTLNSGSNIGINTVVSFDTGSLSISGSGVGLATRGALINMYGVDHATQPGNLLLNSGTTVGIFKINTGNTTRVTIDLSGITTFSKTGNSTNSTTAPVVFTGGVSISNTTNSSSNSNGGSLTVGGGASVADDLYVGGNLIMSGTIPGATTVTSPTVTTYNLINITSTSQLNVKLRKVGVERHLTCIVGLTPSAVRSQCTFEIELPGVVTNFTNPYDICGSINGYLSDFTPIENMTVYAVTGTLKAKVKFTSGPTTGTHYIQLSVNFTLI